MFLSQLYLLIMGLIYFENLTRPGTIVFSLTASVVSIEVNISADGLILNSFQVGKENYCYVYVKCNFNQLYLCREVRPQSFKTLLELK